jgi:hypothetical protein
VIDRNRNLAHTKILENTETKIETENLKDGGLLQINSFARKPFESEPQDKLLQKISSMK